MKAILFLWFLYTGTSYADGMHVAQIPYDSMEECESAKLYTKEWSWHRHGNVYANYEVGSMCLPAGKRELKTSFTESSHHFFPESGN